MNHLIRILFTLFICFVIIGKVNSQPNPPAGPFTILDSFELKGYPDSIYFSNIIYSGYEYWLTDRINRSLYVFDTAGNYIQSFPMPNNRTPNGMAFKDPHIIISVYTSWPPNTEHLYFIDKNTKQLDTIINTPDAYGTMCFDSTLNNNLGGFWVLSLNKPNNKRYIIDMNGQFLDSIIVPTFPYLLTQGVDYSSFGSKHIISFLGGAPIGGSIRWFDLSQGTWRNDYYSPNLDIGFCTQPSGMYITNDLYPNMSSPQIITVVNSYRDLKHTIIIYEAGIPPAYPPPPNDQICNALLMEIDSAPVLFNNIGGTIDSGEVQGACYTTPFTNTVWMKIPVTKPSFRVQRVIANTVGSNFCSANMQAEIGAFKSLSDCQDSLIEVGCDNVSSPKTDAFGQILGDTVYIQFEAGGDENYAFLQATSLPTISRDFEYYDTTQFIALYDDEWELSQGLNAGIAGQDAKVSDDVSQSGNYSLKVDSSSIPSFYLYDLDSSTHLIGFSMYIPSGNQHYFEILDSDSTSLFYARFDPTGTGIAGADSSLFLFPFDQWFTVECYVDLENDKLQFRVSGNFITLNVLLSQLPVLDLAYLQFNPTKAGPGNNTAYIDDMWNFAEPFPNIPGSALSNFDLIDPIPDANLVVDNGVLYNNLFDWQQSSDQLGTEVHNELLIFIDSGGFSIEKMNIDLDTITSFSFTESLVDSLFGLLSRPLTDTLRVHWDVKASTLLNQRSASNGPRFLNIYKGVYVGLETEISGNIRVYPNPADNELTIAIDQGEAEIEIYDLQGGLKIRQRVNHKTSIDVSHLSAGMYILRISGFGQAHHVKIILK